MKKTIILAAALLLVASLFTACEEITDTQSSNADLSDVTFVQTVNSAYNFNPDTTSYTIVLADEQDIVNITPTADDPAASIRIKNTGNDLDYTDIDSGASRQYDLILDGNIRLIAYNTYGTVIDIEVTAEDGTTKVYTFTISSDHLL